MILVLFSILAGKYAEALELAKLALKWEEKELGKRPERMVELYGLLTDIYDEVCTAKVSLLHFLFYLQSWFSFCMIFYCYIICSSSRRCFYLPSVDSFC